MGTSFRFILTIRCCKATSWMAAGLVALPVRRPSAHRKAEARLRPDPCSVDRSGQGVARDRRRARKISDMIERGKNMDETLLAAERSPTKILLTLATKMRIAQQSSYDKSKHRHVSSRELWKGGSDQVPHKIVSGQ